MHHLNRTSKQCNLSYSVNWEVGAFGAKPYVHISVADLKQLGTSTAAVVLISDDGMHGCVPLTDTKGILGRADPPLLCSIQNGATLNQGCNEGQLAKWLWYSKHSGFRLYKNYWHQHCCSEWSRGQRAVQVLPRRVVKKGALEAAAHTACALFPLCKHFVQQPLDIKAGYWDHGFFFLPVLPFWTGYLGFSEQF